MFKCTVCGYIHWGEEAPEKCPKCGAPKEKFEQLADDKAELVEKSRVTNELHMELFSLLGEIMDICDYGAEINLDPGCLKIFKSTLEFADERQQEIMAELQGHMNKGKWG